MSEGVNKLIRDGVNPVIAVEDILEGLDIERKTRNVTRDTRMQVPKDRDQVKILSVFDGQTKHIDAIAREVKLPIEKVSSALTLMELSGLVKNYGSGIWGK
jgi:predicted Rossmann fold nucleotide-binding protein DprA/Smf involved in DNA uptake